MPRVIQVLTVLLLALAACTALHAEAFPLIDIPTAFYSEDVLNAHVDSLRSSKSVTPFNYYRLPVCPPTAERIKREKESVNFGTILMGNRVWPSDYNFTIGQPASCVPLCNEVHLTRRDVRRASMFITNNYRGHMYLDHLPLISRDGTSTTLGHPLGQYRKMDAGGSAVDLFNHIAFRIRYQKVAAGKENDKDTYYVVGFSAKSSSVGPGCSAGHTITLPESMKSDETIDVQFSYSVVWELEDNDVDVLEARRSPYEALTSVDATLARKGHWVTALNSTMMVLLLSVVVLIVIVRTIRRDLVAYLDEGDMNMSDEHGWKLVRGDAFRAPFQAVLFTSLIASGAQSIVIVVLLVVAAVLRILHSSKRGELLSAIIALFLLTSCVAGYVAARLLKLFHKQSWKNGIFATFFCPLLIVCGYLLLNMINWAKHASLAIPFSYALMLAVMWIFLSMPMGLLGLSVGFRQEVLHVSARVSSIPRLIPREAENRHLSLLWLCAGLLPVLASMLEISYMLSAMWQGQTFYMMGALTLIVFNVFLICAELGVVVTYNTLVRQDYRWWWPSFTSLGSAGVFLFLYTLFYLIRYLSITAFASIILYMGYMAGLASFFGVMCGTISTVASFIFVNVLYTVVKAD